MLTCLKDKHAFKHIEEMKAKLSDKPLPALLKAMLQACTRHAHAHAHAHAMHVHTHMHTHMHTPCTCTCTCPAAGGPRGAPHPNHDPLTLPPYP